MTVIEFFDKSPIENIISAFTICPQKIIFVGETKMIKKNLPVYQRFLSEKGLKIKLEYLSVNKNNLWDIVSKLSSVVEKEEECTFDLTGGEDLVLVATGIIFHTYKDKKKVHMHRFNIRNGTTIDCDNDGKVPYQGDPELSVEEWIALHGGIVANKATEKEETLLAHREDIMKIWNLCRENPGLWNFQVGILNEFQKYRAGTENPLRIYIDISYASMYIKNIFGKKEYLYGLLNLMKRQDLIFDLKWNDDEISFVYSNEFVKCCVAKAGDILETKILQVVNDMKDENGAYFCDAERGVFIDWDGTVHTNSDDEKDTANEIDVFVMRDLIPVFISCKNGAFDDEELYKLYTVASRFGGVYAKKILVCSDFFERSENTAHLEQRAKDMQIKIIDGVHKLPDQEIQKKIKEAIS